MDAEINGFEEARNNLESLASASPGKANDALKEFAEDTKRELQSTSPVDTGEYKASWELIEVAEDEVWLVNTAPHAKYVAFPNAQMVGVTSADDPARGILHNVRGIVHQREKALGLTWRDKLLNWLF